MNHSWILCNCAHECDLIETWTVFRNTASQALDQNNVAQITGGSSKIDAHQTAPEHMGHMDQTQMTKWYQQYKMFKNQQAQL